jgi:hypothetical protein
VPDAYRDFFVAVTGAAGALTGLVFVVISILPERLREIETDLEFQVGAAGTLLIFTNPLVLSLAALVPGTGLGWWVASVSAIGLAFAAAIVRVRAAALRQQEDTWGALRRSVLLVVFFGFQLATGITLITRPDSLSALRSLDYLCIAALLIGVFRAARLIGLRDTGLFASLRLLVTGRDSTS